VILFAYDGLSYWLSSSIPRLFIGVLSIAYFGFRVGLWKAILGGLSKPLSLTALKTTSQPPLRGFQAHGLGSPRAHGHPLLAHGPSGLAAHGLVGNCPRPSILLFTDLPFAAATFTPRPCRLVLTALVSFAAPCKHMLVGGISICSCLLCFYFLNAYMICYVIVWMLNTYAKNLKSNWCLRFHNLDHL